MEESATDTLSLSVPKSCNQNVTVDQEISGIGGTESLCTICSLLSWPPLGGATALWSGNQPGNEWYGSLNGGIMQGLVAQQANKNVMEYL